MIKKHTLLDNLSPLLLQSAYNNCNDLPVVNSAVIFMACSGDHQVRHILMVSNLEFNIHTNNINFFFIISCFSLLIFMFLLFPNGNIS